eukprot:CAMPEP_0175821998 /NCGR_PEP_ID=MMETSP0107_2-20121207/9441_1 /TAXON_ID=195067 ORGANISM="Goniomonas pacifica, Strain CCMP1869" /NCGR_SAMPLE_ID=MMETSP0107_2 /ASSEMBLY_ACC=CAM_ASM_000203 /LENGTH=146 /DNA_ID=CAMNT_0017134429 /DNA_START=13 /DNA_END=454 /DNA_ORIENTATION=+
MVTKSCCNRAGATSSQNVLLRWYEVTPDQPTAGPLLWRQAQLDIFASTPHDQRMARPEFAPTSLGSACMPPLEAMTSPKRSTRSPVFSSAESAGEPAETSSTRANGTAGIESGRKFVAPLGGGDTRAGLLELWFCGTAAPVGFVRL